MKPFVLTLAALLSAIAAFVYWADPAHQWHRLSYPTEPIARGEVWYWPGRNIDQVTAKRQMAKIFPKPDVVILGSSRVLNPRYDLFVDSLRRLNLGVGFATVPRARALWAALVQSNHRPRYVIWAPDPWLFREGWSRSYPVPRDGNWKKSVSNLRELLNLQMLQASVRATVNPEPREFYYRWDGSRGESGGEAGPIQAAPTKRTAPAARAAAQPWQYAVYLLTPWKVSAEDLRESNEMLGEWRRDGVSGVLVALPFRSETYQALIRHPQSAPALREYLRVMRALAAAHELKFCDRLDPASAGCSPDEFVDAAHLDDACMEKVLRSCLTPYPDWRQLLAAPLPGGQVLRSSHVR